MLEEQSPYKSRRFLLMQLYRSGPASRCYQGFTTQHHSHGEVSLNAWYDSGRADSHNRIPQSHVLDNFFNNPARSEDISLGPHSQKRHWGLLLCLNAGNYIFLGGWIKVMWGGKIYWRCSYSPRAGTHTTINTNSSVTNGTAIVGGGSLVTTGHPINLTT